MQIRLPAPARTDATPCRRAGWCWRWILFLLAGAAGAAGQDGTLQWAFSVRPGFISSSAALGADGATIFFGVETQTGGRIVAVTREGALRWSRLTSEFVDASPAVGPDGTVYVGGVDGRLYALNPETGASRWELNVRSFITSSAAIGADGTIYFGAGDGLLRAVTPAGEVRWSFPTGNAIEASPAIGADGTIYVGSYDKSLYAVTPEGAEKWRFATGGRLYSSPAIGADGTIYVGSGDQRLYALRPDGVRKWEYFTNGDIQASPVLGADGTVYFGSLDTNFYALRAADGVERWRTRIGATLAAPAAVRGDGAIIFGSDDGKVRALNPADGSVRWTFDTGTRDLFEAGPLIAPDGAIYLGALDGRFYKLNGSGSPLSEYSAWPSFRRTTARGGRAVTVTGAGNLVNLSTRARAGGTDTIIAGFFVNGPVADAPKAFLLRAVGPTLEQFGVTGFMPDPQLDLYAGSRLALSNDNWEDALPGRSSPVDTAAALNAFPLPMGSRDAAVVEPLVPGLYSVHVRAADTRGGVVLVEAYDAIGGAPSTRLANVSLRNQVGAGENILIMGFVLAGSGPSRVLVRAVGPGLRQFGVADVLSRPTMALYQGSVRLRTNAGWTTEGLTHDLRAAAADVGAFPLETGSADGAMILTLQPGPYTVQIQGIGGETGEAIAEVYVLP